MPNFIHLRVASDFSLLRSTNRIKNLIEHAKNLRFPALVLTDRNNLYGSLEFAETCVKNGIQPIIGAKINIKHDELEGNVLFLVTNQDGYFNLIDLISQIDLDSQFLSISKLFDADLGGLICLAGGSESLLLELIKNNQKPEEFLQKLNKTLAKNHLFLEIQRCDENSEYENEILKLAKKFNLPLVATNDVFFLKEKDFESCDALWAMEQKSYINDDDRKQLSRKKFLKSEEEMCQLFANLPSALQNTVTIAQMCHFWPEDNKIQFPHFTENGVQVDENQTIRRKAQKGLEFCLQSFVLPREIPDYQVPKSIKYDLKSTISNVYINEINFNFSQSKIEYNNINVKFDFEIDIACNFYYKNVILELNINEFNQIFILKIDKINSIYVDLSSAHNINNFDNLNNNFNFQIETKVCFIYKNEKSSSREREIRQQYQKRLEYELEIIIKMGFSGYFLIVSDFIKWAKREGIPVGPGRGSGAGSLVAWALEIVDYDPIFFGLLFERFLNPERVSMPDFDIDFCQERRDEVIQYVVRRYGSDHVANIITFGTMQARGVLRDVGRVLQMPYLQVDKICKMIPNSPTQPITLGEALEKDKKLQEERTKSETIDKLFAISLELEGLHRHTSMHAAGVVIGERPIKKIIPVQFDAENNSTVTQFSMKYAEKSGLIKFDFLGLKTLTVLQKIVQLVKKNHDYEIDFRFLALDDRKTYKMLSSGDNIGIFQLENSFMSIVLKDLKPSNINDIIALISLNRPGPMENIPSYVARKNGEEEVEYDHPMLEDVLHETFGIIVYQEQVMKIAQVMGGYSLGQADILRRAMGKKIQAEMDKQQDIFVQGAIENDVDEEKAEAIFQLVNKFAGYGFNKSHATGYALISYYTAYLKANFKLEFFTSVLNLDILDTDKCSMFVADAKKSGVTILPPCVNNASFEFIIENNCIRYAMSACKNAGIGAVEMIVKERSKNGKFIDIFDFGKRLGTKAVNKKILESLIKVGAFDCFSENRQQFFDSVKTIIDYSNSANKERESMQINLFGASDEIRPELALVEDWSFDDRLQFEFESFGFFFDQHPLEQFVEQLQTKEVIFSDTAHEHKNKIVKMVGVVHDFAIRSTPRGKMAIMKLSDPIGTFKCTIYEEDLLKDEFFTIGTKLALHVNVRMLDGGDTRFYVKAIKIFDINYDMKIPANNYQKSFGKKNYNKNYSNNNAQKIEKIEKKEKIGKKFKLTIDHNTDIEKLRELIAGQGDDQIIFEFWENREKKQLYVTEKVDILNNLEKVKELVCDIEEIR